PRSLSFPGCRARRVRGVPIPRRRRRPLALKIALLFPGQAPKHLLPVVVDTAADPAGRALLDHAAAAAQVPYSRRVGRGVRALDRTEILQPVLTAVALHAATALLDAGI